MNCLRCQRLLSRHLDGDLAPSLCRAVDLHLAECAVCDAVRVELAAVTRQLAGLSQLDPSEALWQRIDARLDAEERARRRPRWPVLAPALGGAALLLTAGAAHVVYSRSMEEARSVDAELRTASSGALLVVERRYAEAEAEALRLATEDRAALRAVAAPDTDQATAAIVPAVAPRTTLSPRLAAAATVEDAAALQAALDDRSSRLLRYAERWAGSSPDSLDPLGSTDSLGAVGSKVPSQALRDPWPSPPARRR